MSGSESRQTMTGWEGDERMNEGCSSSCSCSGSTPDDEEKADARWLWLIVHDHDSTLDYHTKHWPQSFLSRVG